MAHESDQRVEEVLRQIESSPRLSFRGVPHQLGVIRTELFADGDVPNCALRWELISLGLYLSDKPTHWGTLHGPALSGKDENGKRVDSPPLEAFTTECLEYCRRRMIHAEHPVLKARYADVIWDLTAAVAGSRPPIESARIAIDAYLQAIVGDRIDPLGWQSDRIRRMISIAVLTGDDQRLATICESLSTFAASGRDDNEVEWRQRHLLPDLLHIPKKKWPRDIIEKLAVELRARLEHMTVGTGKQWAFQSLVFPLVEFYWSTNRKEDAHVVLKSYGKAVLHEAEGAPAIAATGWIENLYKTYRQYELHGDAAQVMLTLQRRQAEVPEQLARFSTPVVLKKEEVDELIESIITNRLNETLVNLVQNFWLSVEDERKSMLELEQGHPLLSLIPQALLDREGRKVAAIRGVNDEEGRLIRHICENLRFHDLFLQLIFPELIRRFELSAGTLLTELCRSPLWSKDRHVILERGIGAYLEDDPLVAVHLLIPEIEAAVRNLARESGSVLQKLHRNGGYVLKNLDDLLREDSVVSALTEDMAFYLRVVLTDQRGWNLRNVVCHGLSSTVQLNGTVARRLMMIVFLLSSLGASPKEAESGG